MKFDDIPSDIFCVRVKSVNPSESFSQEMPVLGISASSSINNAFEIRVEKKLFTVIPVTESDSKRLGNELLKGASHLGVLKNPAHDGSIELHMATFPGRLLEMGMFEVGVDEEIERSINKHHDHQGFRKKTLNNEEVCEYLRRHCLIKQGEDSYFLMFAGPAIDKVLNGTDGSDDNTEENDESERVSSQERLSENNNSNDQEESDNELDSKKTDIPSHNNSFCIFGDEFHFVVTEKKLASGGAIFVITKLTYNNHLRDRALRLCKGKISFCDFSATGKVGILAKTQLQELMKDENNYLKKWDEYGNEEGDLLLKNARRFGVVSYYNKIQNKNGTTTVSIYDASDSALEDLKNNKIESVEIVEETPDYIKNSSMTFAEFAGIILEKEDEKEKVSKANRSNTQPASTSFEIDEYSYEERTITLKVDDIPYASGMFVMTLAGEIAQIKRRMTARRLILEGRSANPQLGLLIAENGIIERLRSPHKLPPLTAFVRNKVFKNPPTVKQEEAVRVALNTPDIALIQGPPGTGKTTVIQAILERLNEESDKKTKNKGMVLLTGFQHDAVENMIERLSINSLPVPKFGKRSGSQDDEFTTFQKQMEDWCADKARKIRAANHNLPILEKEAKIAKLGIQYLLAPSAELALNIVGNILNLGIEVLGKDVFEQAKILFKQLEQNDNVKNAENSLINIIRGLRCKPESFVDDGADRAAEVLELINEQLLEQEKAILKVAADWYDGDPLTFLPDLEKVKKDLLVRFTMPPVFTVEKNNAEVVDLVKKAVEGIRRNGLTAKDQKAVALLDFLADLETNPYGMIDAVADYSFAFSATCQQCVNKIMQEQKGVNENSSGEKMEYEYVIVDEAARVSPRDLLIPMAQGKKIILVGDHRQLPHIIDEEVAKEMEAGESGLNETDWLKKSMFQYLFSERLKALEEQDPEHPRRVTLDKQYRMHPVLGDFISRNFYERFDPNEKFGSGLPAEKFDHFLPGVEHKPAVWLDVPAEKGSHSRQGTSWIRIAEAKAIASQLKEWMESEHGKDLSYGVISFYKAQADLIRNQFNKQFDTSKLKIGTVDSFQGMEFDVVFLSMVRTLPKNFSIERTVGRCTKIFYEKNPNAQELTRDEKYKLAANSTFGHLCLYNRLNVSMSRQKKLLVVVGDHELLNNDLAKEFIPGLVDFYELCKKEGVVLTCK